MWVRFLHCEAIQLESYVAIVVILEGKNLTMARTIYSVENAKEWKDGNVTFNLVIDDFITVYNCKVIEGKKGDFLSFPQYKGKNGKYYSHAFVKLEDGEREDIIKEARKVAEKQK